jgi:hypothetical protein
VGRQTWKGVRWSRAASESLLPAYLLSKDFAVTSAFEELN